MRNVNLIEKRKAAGYTQIQLAEKAGLNQTSISLYENGLRLPDVVTAKKIATVLGTSIEDIFN